MTAVFRHGEAKDEEQGRTKDQRLFVKPQPRHVLADGSQHAQDVEQPDDRHQRGILEQADKAADDVGDHVFQRLRHDDQPCRAPIAQPDSMGGLVLAFGDGLQSGAHCLGHEQWEHCGGHEQHGDQRNRPEHLDEPDA